MQTQAANQISQEEYQLYWRSVTNLENAHECGIRAIKTLPNGKIIIDRSRDLISYVFEFVKSFFTKEFVKTNRNDTGMKVLYLKDHEIFRINNTHAKLAQILSQKSESQSYYTVRTARLFHELFPKMQAWNRDMDERASKSPSFIERIKHVFENRLGYRVRTPLMLKVNLEIQVGNLGKGVDSPECADFVKTLKTIRSKRWDYQPSTMLSQPRNLWLLHMLGKIGWVPAEAKAIETQWGKYGDKEIAPLASKHTSKMSLDWYAIEDYLETGDLADENPYFGIDLGLLGQMGTAMRERNPDLKQLMQFAKATLFHARQLRIGKNYLERNDVPASLMLLQTITKCVESSLKTFTPSELTATFREMLELASTDGYMRCGSASTFAFELISLLVKYGKGANAPPDSLKAILADFTKGLIAGEQLLLLQKALDVTIKETKYSA